MATQNCRLSIEVTPQERRRLKILAEAQGLTLKALVFSILEPILYPERVPNEETIKALEDCEKGVGLTVCDSIEDFWNKMGFSPRD